MPSAGLLALLDDIASILDDVATMTKVAAEKTSAVIGDDLALNANQLAGIRAARELPVVYAVAKGSLVNKAILIPAAIAITAFVPFLVAPLLMLGGAYLCYEGAEKVLHKLHKERHEPARPEPLADPASPEDLERRRIKGAIVTDFILSAEILIIALGASAGQTVTVQALTLLVVGIGMTILVYGSVALVVKADDIGLRLQARQDRMSKAAGHILVAGAPRLMKALSFLGTAAMFAVGGEIIAHGIPPLEQQIEHVIAALPASFRGAQVLAEVALVVLGGIVAGGLLVFIKTAATKLLRPAKH